jgi:hypothetical protein
MRASFVTSVTSAFLRNHASSAPPYVARTLSRTCPHNASLTAANSVMIDNGLYKSMISATSPRKLLRT